MKLRNSEQGMGVIFILLLVAVIVIIGAIAYRLKSNVYNTNSASAGVSTTAQVAAPKTIASKADLQQASKALEALQINQELNPDQLSGNIKTLL